MTPLKEGPQRPLSAPADIAAAAEAATLAERRASVYWERILVAALCSFLYLALIWGATWIGLFRPWQVILASITVTAIVMAVLTAFRLGLNRRLADPGMTRLQVVAAMSVILVVAHVAGDDRGFFLLLTPIAFTFAIFRLPSRELYQLSALTLLGAVAGAALTLWSSGSWALLPQSLLHLSGLALMLGILSFVGGKVNDFRQRTRLERRMAQVTLKRMGDGVITIDAEGRVMYVNALAEAMTGWTSARAIGRFVGDVVPADGTARTAWLDVYRQAASLPPGEFVSGRTDFAPETGPRVEIEFTCSLFSHDPADARIAVLVFRDVTERTRLVEQLAHDATHDTLTGLLNRRAFRAEVDRAIEEARAHGRTHCIAVVDLDQFKVVNDVCGHAAGDQLLRLLASRMRTRLRQGDVLARLGGDEFGLVLLNISPGQALGVVEKLTAAIGDFRFTWTGRLFKVGASAGLAPLGDGSIDGDTAISRADGACYLAKDRGRNRVQLYEERDEDVRQQRQQMDWVSRLNHAVEDGRFVLFGQRIMPIQPDVLAETHVEVLLRMRDVDGGLLEPMSFLPAADRFGLTGAIDRWVVRTALDTLSAAIASRVDSASPWPRIAINLSTSSMTSPAVAREIVECIRAATLVPPECVCFEVKETAAIANLAEAAGFINDVRALGCTIALDDAGTSFSSFAQLRGLPVDYLKIDGSFVRTILENPVDRAMVESIQHVASAVGLRTVAGYLDDLRALPALREIGVDYAQGRGIHAPEPLADVLHAIGALGGPIWPVTDTAWSATRVRM
jgi:diguanylate cyclase (GGDEF)-like protein/PAS domain S-box-containing protein